MKNLVKYILIIAVVVLAGAGVGALLNNFFNNSF